MKKVLILSDSRAGHFNQSLAVSEAIQSFGPVEEVYVEVKVKKLGKYFLRILLNSRIGRSLFKNRPSLKLIQTFYEGYEWNGKPDIIISAGKDTSLINAMLALMYESINFFIGNPKKLEHHLFSGVLTVLNRGFDNQIVLNVAPTKSYSGDLTEFTRTYKLESHYEYYTLLIGGDGSGYKFGEEDIDKLITFVNTTASKVKWLVTTSRRTSEVYEEKMEKEMQTECFIAYHKNPQKVVAGFLELSTAVFVTEESASMVSESVAFKKPTIALAPKQYSADKSYQKILHKFSLEKRIQRVEISRLDNFEVDLENFKLLELDSCNEIAKKLKSHLLKEVS